ncbi:MAG: LysO family transporter [Bacteroidales bacterium]|nr:LysO family transporter [Bacteroidales bacterium]
MLKIAVVLLSGIAFGVLLRKHPVKILPRIIMVLVWILLLLIGIEVGSDPRIIGHLQDLGLEALALTLSGLAGSMGAAFALWKYADHGTGR